VLEVPDYFEEIIKANTKAKEVFVVNQIHSVKNISFGFLKLRQTKLNINEWLKHWNG